MSQSAKDMQPNEDDSRSGPEIEVEVPGESPVVFRQLTGDRGSSDNVAAVRLAYAAAHVILLDDYAEADPEEDPAPYVDWDRTLAFRRHLDQQGFGIAEAMDTAQRFDLGWETAQRLIVECGRLRPQNGFVAGAGCDQRVVNDLADLVDAVTEQIDLIQSAGGIAIVLPMPQLCAWKSSEEEFVHVYRSIIERCDGPLFLHWLGPMFMPALDGYFPGDSFDRIMALDREKIRGVKMSLLDRELELRVRADCRKREQIVLTGDDFHFAELIEGNSRPPERTIQIGDCDVADGDFSHALLGVFDGIAVPAGRALRALAAGDLERYRALMGPCEAYGQHVFCEPTSSYKVGLAFTAWLDGHQPNAMLVRRLERTRDRRHLLGVARAAAAAGAFRDEVGAAARLERWIAGADPRS